MMKLMRTSVGGALLVCLGAAQSAGACGGLFCSFNPPAQPTAPEPVDQTAERIVFDMTVPDGFAMHVQVSYAGPADEFAWVLPVPAGVGVEESSPDLFDELQAITAMTVTLPPQDPCPNTLVGEDSDSSFGCGSSDNSTPAGGQPTSSQSNGSRNDSGVVLYDSGSTDNYDWVEVGSTDATLLVKWLQENGYNVSDNMAPGMTPYQADGLRWIALQLRDGKSAQNVVPIKLTLPGDVASIPLQLTAVAARPHMGIQVFVVASTPYIPANVDFGRPDAEAIHLGAGNTTSYFEWVARVVDESSGKYFVQEAVTNLPVNGAPAGIANSTGAVVSRYYARVSPEHMTFDPMFVADPTQEPVPRGLDLSTKTTLFACGQLLTDRLPSPCAFMYCGSAGTCVEENGQAACVCEGDSVATELTAPDGSPRITCTPRVNPLAITDAAGGAGTPFDPCSSFDCGTGTCILKGGFPTCECPAGVGALLDAAANVTCSDTPASTVTFGPGAGIESAAAPSEKPTPSAPTPSGATGFWAMCLLIAGAGIRRWLVTRPGQT